MTLAEPKWSHWLVVFLQLAVESLIFYIDSKINMYSVLGIVLQKYLF